MKFRFRKITQLFAFMLLLVLILGAMTGCYDSSRDQATEGTFTSIESKEVYTPKHLVSGRFFVTYMFQAESLPSDDFDGMIQICFFDETGESLLNAIQVEGDIEGKDLTVRIARRNDSKIAYSIFGDSGDTLYLNDPDIEGMQVCLKIVNHKVHNLTYKRGGITFLDLGILPLLTALLKVVLIYGIGACILIFMSLWSDELLPGKKKSSALTTIKSIVFGVCLFVLLALLKVPVIRWLNLGADLITNYNLPEIPSTGWVRIVLWIVSVLGMVTVFCLTWSSCKQGYHKNIIPCMLISSILHAIYFYMMVLLICTMFLASIPLVILCLLTISATEASTSTKGNEDEREPSEWKVRGKLNDSQVLVQNQYGEFMTLTRFKDPFAGYYYSDSDGNRYEIK